MTSADLSAEAATKAGRPLSARERMHEVAAVLAQGVLRLKTWPANAPENPPESPQISLDVRRDISPHVSDG